MPGRPLIETATDLGDALIAAIYYGGRVLKSPHGVIPFNSDEITYRFNSAIEIGDQIFVADCADPQVRRIFPHGLHEFHDGCIEARTIIRLKEFKARRRHVETMPKTAQYDITRVPDGQKYPGRRK